MSYYNPVAVEQAMRERQQALLKEAERRRMVRTANSAASRQPRPKLSILSAIRNLGKAQPVAAAVCAD